MEVRERAAWRDPEFCECWRMDMVKEDGVEVPSSREDKETGSNPFSLRCRAVGLFQKGSDFRRKFDRDGTTVCM